MTATGRKTGRTPTYARNMAELGACLIPPRDRKIIQRAMRLPGCPGRMADGRYHIAEWDVFISNNFGANDTGQQPEKLKLTNEKLELEIRKLRFDLSIKQREFSANSDIEIWVGDLVMQAKRVLLSIPSKVAPIVVGLTEVEAEILLKEEINAALGQLTSRPLNGEYATNVAD